MMRRSHSEKRPYGRPGIQSPKVHAHRRRGQRARRAERCGWRGSLSLADANRAARMSLIVNQKGEPIVQLCDGDGKPRAAIALSNGHPSVGLHDAAGGVRLSFGVTDKDEPIIELRDKSGKRRASLALSFAGEPRLVFSDSEGVPSCAAGRACMQRSRALDGQAGLFRKMKLTVPETCPRCGVAIAVDLRLLSVPSARIGGGRVLSSPATWALYTTLLTESHSSARRVVRSRVASNTGDPALVAVCSQ